MAFITITIIINTWNIFPMKCVYISEYKFGYEIMALYMSVYYL